MLTPGSPLWLLAHELRLGWRNWWGATRMRGRWLVIFYASVALVTLFGAYWAAKLLSIVPPVANEPVLVSISGVFAFLSTFMLAQAIASIVEAVHQRGDLDLLLSSPIPAWRVLIVRMAGVAFNVAAFYLVLLGAVFVWLPLHGGWRWMGFAPSVFALALVVTALGLVVARIMFSLIGPARTRIAAQILAALVGAGFFLFYQFNALTGDRDVFYDRIVALVRDTDWDLRSPFFLPARAALGDPAALAIWLGLACSVYALAVLWFAGPFVSNAAALVGLGARRKRDRRRRDFADGLAVVLVRKEWRLLARDPMLLVQVLLPLLYLAPLVYLQWRALGGGGEDVVGVPIGATAGVFVYLGAMLAANLVWFTVSAEDAPDLVAASPVSRARLEYAKAFAAGAPVAALMLVPSIGASLYSPMAGVWLWIGSAAAVASTCLIGVWRQQPGARRNFRRRAPRTLATSMGQFFVNFCWAGATGFAAGGVPLLGLIPALIAIGLLLALQDENGGASTAQVRVKAAR
jgi:ABC-2 type transport system permease protein